MCEFQSLYYGDQGYVIRCAECTCYQVAFGTTMLTLTQEDFDMLLSIVDFKCQESVEMPPRLRNIVVPTPGQGVSMLLSLEEIFVFSEMLDKADTEYKSRKMIDMFHSG